MTRQARSSPRSIELRSSDQERHASGSYFTPPELVDRVVRLALDPLVVERSASSPWRELRRFFELRILDPAAGDGAFLAGAASYLVEVALLRFPSFDRHRLRAAVVRRCLFGIDLHPGALSAAQARLTRMADQCLAGERYLARHLRCADSLLVNFSSLWPGVMLRGGFDAVVGNPPFVDAETMTRNMRELRAKYRERWSTARGNWDLCVPFVELCLTVVRPQGQVALVLPNKLLSARYAERIRRELKRHVLRKQVDLSKSSSFRDADVFPVVLHVERAASLSEGDTRKRVASTGLLTWGLEETSDRWKNTVPIGAVAQITGAATVAEAYEMAEAIVDSPRDGERTGDVHRVVNTGTIGRYEVTWGVKPLRYLGQSYLRPVIPRAALRGRWPRRAEQACAPKIVVAGLSKSLRAYLDRPGELLAAKSTVVIRSPLIDLRLMIAVLNSRWMSNVYRERFGGLTLQGGYLQFTTAHLKALPFPSPERCQERRPLVEAIIALVDAIAAASDPGEFQRHDETIEARVRELFEVGNE